MATSLAEQLRKLRTPQTAVLLQDKKRPSLLFNPKEAANLDRAIVLNIGQSGLQDLAKLCPSFVEFENSLFSPSSANLERSVQDSVVNDRLNAAIAKFLIRLSPYFLLNSAHKALEWLIHRFHIHRYNRNDFMMLILPYHETRIFVRALQLLDLSDASDRWNWLAPLQKPGLTLPSLSLVSRLATDNGLLKMLCKHVVEATTICGDRAASLSTLYAFWTMSIVGALERSAAITELQTIHVLACLAKGLTSPVIDFAAGSYMIVAKLCTRASLDVATLDYLLAKTLKNARLPYEATLLVFFVYENASSRPCDASEKIVKRVARSPFFVDHVNRIKESGLDVTRFLVPFLASGLDIVLKRPSEESEKIRQAISAILDRVSFDEAEIDLVLERIARAEPTSDTCHEATVFLADLYDRLEKLYPARFDEHLKRLMMTSVDSGASKATLHFLMSWHTGARNAKDSLDILDRLNHHSAEQRIAALRIISRGEIAITETFRDTVNRAMLARFSDDDPRVVRSLLEFPRDRLKSLFPCDTLVDELMLLLAQCNSRKRSGLARLAIGLLLDICEDADDTSVFIATLPYLFPSEESEVEIAMSILRSEYSEKNRYMRMVRADVGEDPNAEAVGSAAFHNILKWELLPPTANILGTMKFQSCRGDATSMLFNLVLLGSVCRVPVGSLSYDVALEVIEIADEITRNHPRVKRLESCNQLNAQRISEALVLTSQAILPLQAFTYVIEMVHRRVDIKSNPRLDFEKDPSRTRLVSRLLEILLDGMSHEARRPHFSWCLKIFFQRHFASAREMLVFLSQFFAPTSCPTISLHCLKIAMDLLENSRSYGWIFSDEIFGSNLLIALSRRNVACRQAAVELLCRITRTFNLSMAGHSTLFHELASRSAELTIDPDQLSLALYNLLSPDPDVTASLKREIRASLEQSRVSLLATLVAETTPVHTVAQLLEVLVHVNGPEILRHLAPLGIRLHREPCDVRRDHSAVALRNILQRINSTSVEALADPKVGELFDSAMSDHRARLPIDEIETSPSTIVARQIDEAFYERAGRASRQLQKKILSKLVDVVTDCEIGSVVAACNRAVRRIIIDARSVVEELRAMKDARVAEVEGTRPKRRSRIVQLPRPEVVDTRDWKRGITLLEFVQRAENIENEEALVPMLFDILRVSLSFEIQSPLEYANQLVLSTIYHLATKSCAIKEAHLHIDLIAQCIRISHNPQTHHHALLVLVELFRVANVEAALHSIMPIFTFMGSSVLRQDDAYSIQIISKTIETIVPIVSATNDETHACEIIRVFVVSLPHIPEHRRIPVFVKLLQLLDKHLHLFFLVIFDAHVLAAGKPEAAVGSRPNSSERLEFALTIAQEFSHSRLLRVGLEILRFVRSLPVEVDEDGERRSRLEFGAKHVFDAAHNSPKQLRHYKYTAIQFLVALLTSPSLVRSAASREDLGTSEIEDLYDGLIVEVVMLVESATKSADLHQAKLKGKYWKVLLHNLYDILDAVNNLLPNRIFVSTVVRLVDHDLLSVRKKALELLNARLQQRKFVEEDHEALLKIVQSLRDIVARQGKVLSPELEIIQQTALISLKLMARLLATDHPAQFKPILELTTELMKTKEGPLLASSVLCVAELCASMRTHAIQSLNKFVPAIIRLLRTRCHQESPDVVVVGIVSALQKIVESVGNFLSLYLDKLLLELTRLRSRYTDTENPKIGLILSRLRATTEKLASCIPMRVLLPAISKTYEHMLASGTYVCIPPLMGVLADSFAHVPPNELKASIPDLASFFLGVLQFREAVKIAGERAIMEIDEEEEREERVANFGTRNDEVAKVEESASQALVALVLKLSEATFRPLYYKLYDWAARYPDMKHRNITFYRLSATIAEHLKSLFVLFAGQFLKHAASLLRANNSIVAEAPSDLRLPEERDRLELVEAILLALHRVFSYDAHNFVNQERFESLAQPIVDQLENTTGTREDYERRSRDLAVPCVASFASATQDDSLHKQLVYQVLLKTRHAKPYVRSAALAAIIEIARKLGEDFMPLLPETVPFLAELLEDEDEGTEKRAQNAVRTLEEILGEPLQKYF